MPDRPGSETNRPNHGRALPFAIAVMVIVVGFTLMGVLSPADPVAVEESTTTTATPLEAPIDPDFSVSQIAQGDPLEWQLLAAFDAGYPIALSEHDDSLFLFASRAPKWQTGPGGLVAWRSHDGENWTRIGEVIGSEFFVKDVVASPQGLIAVGAQPGGSEVIVWRSTDGATWTPSAVPTEADSAYLTPVPMTAAADEDTVVVSGYIQREPEALLEDRLAAIGVDIDLSGRPWDIRFAGQDKIALTVYGPLFTPAVVTPLDELDLTEEEKRLVSSGHDSESYVWVQSGDSEWVQSEPPTGTLTSIVGRPGEGFVALGAGGAGLQAAHYSDDGHEWTPTRVIPSPPSIARTWGDRMVGISGSPRVKVSTSAEGRRWERVGPGNVFPTTVSWQPMSLATGREGVAAVVLGPGPLSFQPQPSEMIVTSLDGPALKVDFIRREFVIDVDDETLTWDMQLPGEFGSRDAPEGIRVDLTDELVHFDHPATGETVATFSFEELMRTQSRTFARRTETTWHVAFLFSADGSDWVIQDLGQVTGNGGRVGLLEVGAGHVTAVVEPTLEPGQQNPAPGFEIWSAEIP